MEGIGFTKNYGMKDICSGLINLSGNTKDGVIPRGARIGTGKWVGGKRDWVGTGLD